MNFSFDGEFAKEHGVNEAIMYQYFSYWIAKNKANDKHFYDGYTWTYNSQKALTELFPFWNRAKIQRIISSLENQGLLIKGNYNQLSYDRTTWYALPKFEQSVVQNQTVNCSDLNNERFKNEQPIPINYQLTKQLTNKDIKDIVEHSPTEPVPYQEVVEYLNQKTGKNFKHTSKVTQRHIRARFAEGFTVNDFKQVIDKKCSDWLRDQKMKEYLRPETLFGTKFESYLNSKTTTTKQTGPYIDSCGLKVL
nr:MAG TPA: hypothetical protein [Caudoviricetes sp.]